MGCKTQTNARVCFLLRGSALLSRLCNRELSGFSTKDGSDTLEVLGSANELFGRERKKRVEKVGERYKTSVGARQKGVSKNGERGSAT